jgi:predicted nucleotidyltransferase
MSRIPQKPEETFGDFVHDYKQLYGPDLISVILYGSSVRGEYIPGTSDINFMIILTDEALDSLSRAMPLVAKWHKSRVSAPLFLSKTYIASSLDSFPIEFLNFKIAHRLIYGEDVLKDLAFDRRLVRIQCERELKGKLLQLRQNFLVTRGDKKAIEELIRTSLPTFFSIFQAILFLHVQKHIIAREPLLASIAQLTGLNKDLFLELSAIRDGRTKLESGSAIPLMERYIQEIRGLATYIDQFQFKGE